VVILRIDPDPSLRGDQLDTLDGFADGIRRYIALADLLDRLLKHVGLEVAGFGHEMGDLVGAPTLLVGGDELLVFWRLLAPSPRRCFMPLTATKQFPAQRNHFPEPRKQPETQVCYGAACHSGGFDHVGHHHQPDLPSILPELSGRRAEAARAVDLRLPDLPAYR